MAATSPVPVLLRALGRLTTVVFGLGLLATGLFLVYTLTIQQEPRWMPAVAAGAMALCYVMAFGVGDGLRDGLWGAAIAWLLVAVAGSGGCVVGMTRLWAWQHQPGIAWPAANAMVLAMALLGMALAVALVGIALVLANTRHFHLHAETIAEEAVETPVVAEA